MTQVPWDGLLDNTLFRIYAFYASILVLKMMFMSALTASTRILTEAASNTEDAAVFKGRIREHEDVERVRRAHLNDLENIPIFLLVSLLYVLTSPSPFFAAVLIRIFTLARFFHTFFYAIVITPQPARSISWIVGFGITGYMALQNVMYFI